MPLELENVGKIVGEESHISGASLSLARGTFNVVLGPALAGKTSLLRLMAGLDSPSSGRVLMDGRDIGGVPLKRRRTAMVYQQFINYPNLTVFENIASPMRAEKRSESEIRRKVGKVAEMLQISPLLSRRPNELSGGQQQRTALARALAKDADIILLDEPLANLDYKLREELRESLPSFFADADAVAVYATAEPLEALRFGRDTVILHEGKIAQIGAASAVYRRPENIRAAEVFSDPPMNFLRIRISGGAVCIDGESLPAPEFMRDLPTGEYTAGFRPNHLGVETSGANQADGIALPATVALAEITGAETFIHLDWHNKRFVSLASGVRELNPGDAAVIRLQPRHFLIFADDGRRLAAPPNLTAEK